MGVGKLPAQIDIFRKRRGNHVDLRISGLHHSKPSVRTHFL